jgi:hypothetical protein
MTASGHNAASMRAAMLRVLERQEHITTAALAAELGIAASRENKQLAGFLRQESMRTRSAIDRFGPGLYGRRRYRGIL